MRNKKQVLIIYKGNFSEEAISHIKDELDVDLVIHVFNENDEIVMPEFKVIEL